MYAAAFAARRADIEVKFGHATFFVFTVNGSIHVNQQPDGITKALNKKKHKHGYLPQSLWPPRQQGGANTVTRSSSYKIILHM
jgi:hypothetical protein